MEMKEGSMHLTAERIQAFLDGALPQGERVGVEEHAASCGACHEELDTWQLLYSELSDLPELAPSDGFASRVLANVEVAVPDQVALPVAPDTSAVEWLRRGTARVAGHLSPERLQDYVDGLLPQPQMASIITHLEGCGACRTEAASWSALVRQIEVLPELAPSAGFAKRVMAQIRVGQLVRAPVAASNRTKVLAWAGRLLPRTQKAWAIISGVAVTPATVAALLVYTVFSNPAVTPGYLASFVWWQISGAASVVASLATETVLDSSVMFSVYSALEALAGAPVLAAMGAVSLAAAMSVSGWVLYRNLLPTPKVDGTYATASI